MNTSERVQGILILIEHTILELATDSDEPEVSREMWNHRLVDAKNRLKGCSVELLKDRRLS